jgi:hypothetical protein
MTKDNRRVGISNRMSPEDEARDAQEHPPLDRSDPTPQDAAGRVGDESGEGAADRQTSLKTGSRSTAQKEAGTRHHEDPAPPSRKVSGAFGREGQDNE